MEMTGEEVVMVYLKALKKHYETSVGILMRWPKFEPDISFTANKGWQKWGFGVGLRI